VARLIITEPDGAERSVALPARSIRIGRGADNDVVLHDAGKGVSRVHAELRLEHGRHILVDLQSQNGTWVNGKRIQREPVSPGSEIAIGLYRLRLEPGLPGVEASPAGDISEIPLVRSRPAAVEASPPEAAAGRPAATKAPLPKWLLFAGGVVVGMTVLIVGRVMTSPVARTPAPARVQPGVGTPTGTSSQVPAEPAPPSADATPSPSPSTAQPEDHPRSNGHQQAVVNVRAEAQRLLDAGVKLDAAGDWLGALRKFEQARALDAELPGLAGAETQVRVRLREAGLDALKRARSYDAAGRTSDALREYERAAQWLPSADPDQQVALTRAAQLRGGVR
jgi:predicted component of type VI protein secretion system